MGLIRRIFSRIINPPALTDEQISAAIKSRIIDGGGKVGEKFDLVSSSIDMLTPYLLSIGDNVTLSGAKVLTHDASVKKSLGYTKVGAVSIGNNVFVGWGECNSDEYDNRKQCHCRCWFYRMR